jgi:hypothetical protein
MRLLKHFLRGEVVRQIRKQHTKDSVLMNRIQGQRRNSADGIRRAEDERHIKEILTYDRKWRRYLGRILERLEAGIAQSA